MNRFRDWLHERHIQHLRRRYLRGLERGYPSADLMCRWSEFADALQARSPAQVARMERQQGLGK